MNNIKPAIATIGQDFVEFTQFKYQDPGPTDQQAGLERIPSAKPPSGKETIKLPDWKNCKLEDRNIREIILKRRSVRNYSDSPLSLEELSYVLFLTQGIPSRSRPMLRTVPSGGAMHPFETYLAIGRVEGLISGGYHFLPVSHSIELFSDDPKFFCSVVDACLSQDFLNQAAVILIWTALPYRTVWRYKQRGYRYIFLDAGHLCQNAYLAAESIGAGCCAIGAFDDGRMNELVSVNGKDEFVIYIGAVGKRK